MLKRLFNSDKRIFFILFVVVFISISFIFLVITMLIHSDSDRIKRMEIDISGRSLIASEQYFITYRINRLTSDVQFISDTLEQNYPDDGDFSKIEILWSTYSDNRKIYDQIRYIDIQGNEVVRVNYSADGADVVPKDQLQNKKDRYYFQKASDLNRGQIYISPLDLNMENGAIELPIKPVIRLAEPIFDQNGAKKGIVILNYSASDILSQIAAIAANSFGVVSFLNADGYWLYNSVDGYKDWAFAYNPESTVKFPNYYPEEWESILAGGTGTLTTPNGYFAYAEISASTIQAFSLSELDLSNDIGNWYIVTFISNGTGVNNYPSNDLSSLALSTLRQYYFLYIAILLFSAVLAGLITSSRVKSRQVKYFSEYDVMTNAYNRHSGIDKLAEMYKALSKNNCSISVCFIDVNGLKEVNDALGHKAGDELIITVARIIRAHIRENDFIIRLGGDEFLIVFQGIDETIAENVWTRIVAEFDAINENEHRKYLISVSHGIKVLNCTLNQMLDNVLHQADIKMYDEKRQIKTDIRIIRD